MRPTRTLFTIVALLALGGAAPGLAAQNDDDPELTGAVVSATTGEPIAGVWIAMEGWGYGTYSRRDGRFRLPDVPDAPRSFDIEAIGYHSETLTLDPTSGEQHIELQPDPEVLPGLEFLLGHLENRRNGARYFDREALAFVRAWDLGELLAHRGIRRARAFCLDEEPSPGLLTVPPETFYLVEVHGSKVRAYTQEFMERTARQDVETIQEIVRLRLPLC